jgi:hypothetical protein
MRRIVMSWFKRVLIMVAVLGGFAVAAAPSADAAVYYRRIAPVRRVAARAALPPYPIARRAVVGPVYRPVVRPYGGFYRPGFYGPGFYGPGVSVGIGVY